MLLSAVWSWPQECFFKPVVISKGEITCPCVDMVAESPTTPTMFKRSIVTPAGE